MGSERLLTRAQCRAVDRLAHEELGLAGIVLMENAGRSAAELILRACAARGLHAPRVRIACGPGNNGGDGFVAARHLAIAGCTVMCHVTGRLDALRGDARLAAVAARAMGLVSESPFDPEGADVLVDALLGTGSEGAPRGAVAEAIRALAAAARGRLVVALDLPSGLDPDTGMPSDPTVRADLTITFAARKVGFERATAAPWLGAVQVASIGVPESLLERAARLGPGTP